MGRAVLALIALAGCAQSSSVQCADGRVCPGNTTCDAVHHLCLADGQAEVCGPKADGDDCQFGAQIGICDQGICVAVACGNAILDPNETCDDGNSVGGDGCRGDCRKIEMCPDGIVDEGEGCDDGNLNAVDGCDACVETAWTAAALIGGAPNALAIGLSYPEQVATDRQGNVYIADAGNGRVRRVDPSGVVTTVAGTGLRGTSSNGGPATAASLQLPTGIAVDGLGNVFVADGLGRRVRRVDPAGIITTVAGTGLFGSSGDGGPAIVAQLTAPTRLALDGLGNLYILDGSRVRRVDTNGIITPYAGTGTPGFAGDNGPATAAQLNTQVGGSITFGAGALYIADQSNQRIRRVDAAGTITTVAGTGVPGFAGDNGPAVDALLRNPIDVVVAEDGTLFIADALNHRIRRVSANGTIATVAGTGISGFGGDGGPATLAMFAEIRGIGVAFDGSLLVSDSVNQRVRRIATNQVITTYAGSGKLGDNADGFSALSATLDEPFGVASDAAGNIYVADSANHRVRKVETSGVIRTIAGDNGYGFSGDGGPALAAQLNTPYDVAVDASGNVYIAELQNHRIRRVDTNGVITTVAGTGTASFSGDNGQATNATLYAPHSIAIDTGGNLYIADAYNNRVRRVATDGVITTIAGNGSTAYAGDNGPATSAQLWQPQGIAVDGNGNVFVADTLHSVIRKIDSNGEITRVAGTGAYGFNGATGVATDIQLDSPAGVAVTSAGELVIADSGNQRIRRVSAAGVMTTIAGNGDAYFDGDGGPSESAVIQNPADIAIDAVGNLLVADTSNNVVRKISTSGAIMAVAGRVGPDGLGPVAVARLLDPRALVVSAGLTLFAGGGSGQVMALRGSSWLESVTGRYTQYNETGMLARFRAENFGSIGGLAVAGNTIYITETTKNRLHAITMVDPANENTWTIATFANAAATPGFADGAASTARFREPTGLYFDAASNELYVADSGNHVIRAIALGTSVVRTVAGVPATLGYSGDQGSATSALLYAPAAVTRCNNDLFIADTKNHRVRRVALATGVITTVLGTGAAGSSGDGAPSSSLPVDAPRGLACDDGGNLFATSSTTVRLLPADNLGAITGEGPVSTIYGEPPRDTFPASITGCLTGIASIDTTTLQIVDSCSGVLVELKRAAR